MKMTRDTVRGRMYWGPAPVPYGMILMGTVRNGRGEPGHCFGVRMAGFGWEMREL